MQLESLDRSRPTSTDPAVRDLIDRLGEACSERLDTRGDTRERLLQAGIESFAVDGFRATTIRTIAAAVGVTPAAVYAHFSSKEEILSAALARGWRLFLSHVVAPGDPGGPRERLEGLCRRHLDFQMVTHRDVARATDLLMTNGSAMSAVDPSVEPLLRQAHEAYFDQLYQAVVQVSRTSDISPRMQTRAIVVLLNGTCYEPHPDSGPGSVDTLREQYLRLAFTICGVPAAEPVGGSRRQ